MTTETTTQGSTGGFAGDPAEAFAPPASAGGCCGSPATTTASTGELAASTCCGTEAEAQESGGCCGEAAKAQAVASGARCCG